MKNILLVCTGGTIGSTIINGTINTVEHQDHKILKLLSQAYPQSAQLTFKTIQPVQLLSENLFPSVWKILIAAIESENLAQFDGIIITHGTDTLAFTAAALSFYFNAIKIPLLLVSSDYPLEHPLANGIAHMICALEFIKQRKEAGVFVPYKNQGGSTLIHLGTRLASSLQLSGDFISVQSKPYLLFQQNTFVLQHAMNAENRISRPLSASFASHILLIKPYPGLNYSHFNLSSVKVVIHDLYHSGTACSSSAWGENHSLTKFIKKCSESNIHLYMAPAVKNSEVYLSTSLLLQQGAKMIWNMSLEAAYVKLLIAYGNFDDIAVIDQFLEQSIALEHLD